MTTTVQAYLDKIRGVESALQSKDIDYGTRMFLDAVMFSKNYDFYHRALNLMNLRYDENQTESFIQQALDVCNDLKSLELKAGEKKDVLMTTIGLTKSYGMGRFQLGPIHLQVEPGKIYGLVGENGNGKTTLLRMLAQDLSHTGGEAQYYFDSKSRYDLRSKLVYIPQRTPKRYGRILEHLKFTAAHFGIKGEANQPKVLMAIARMGLWKYKDLNWSELSSGYKMRFELARTLLTQPKILLLDEPLANLDILAQQVVLEDLRSLANSPFEPIGIVLSSQQLYEVEKVSDKVIYLRNGKSDDELKLHEDQRYQLVVEMDTDLTREELIQGFSPEEIHFNGGVYVLKYKEKTFSALLKELAEKEVPMTYIRNISQSSRRFFVN